MSSQQPHDMYYENPNQRSPGSHRQPSHTVQRQNSRPFDNYSTLPANNMYPAEDHSAQTYIPRYPDRMGAATLNSAYPPYDPWGNSFGPSQGNTLAALGATTRMKPPLGMRSGNARAGLPTPWLDQGLPQMQPFPGMDGPAMGHPSLRGDQHSLDVDEELIPTAIVIKNIPFAVKKEQLVQLMTEMGLPLPYAFNYHFDNGIFRGLAFANFTTPEETAMVIEALNHFELSGRKLRVEYKKMLPLAERERIEREKRIKRGQLEEQHRPLPSTQLQTQSSLSSLSSQLPAASPSPVSARPKLPGLNVANGAPGLPQDLDFNDPQVLNLYSQLLLFKEDTARDSMILPATLSPAQRRVVHTIAHHWRLAHVSKGTGDQRAVHIFRYPEGANISPPISDMPTGHANDTHRRALNRAATTDFTEVRSEGLYGTLGRQTSGLLGFPDSPSGLTGAPNLRSAKSFADLRLFTPSPAPSAASFPINLSGNNPQYAEYGMGSTGASNPNLTSTATTLAGREEAILVNGMNTMAIGNGYGGQSSPRSIRNAWSGERENPGPIGGHRSFSTATQSMEDVNRGGSQAVPQRQPRGPAPERGPGFSRTNRQNGHNSQRTSDELSSQPGVEILVEQ